MTGHPSDSPPLVVPLYLVVDVSASAAGSPAAGASDIVAALVDASREHPLLADVLRFSVIAFNDGARTVRPISDCEFAGLPALMARGGSNYGSAFREIRLRLDHDVADIRMQGHGVYRPWVFFLTSSEPTDSADIRAAEWRALSNRPSRPNIVTFGLGDRVSESTLQTYTLGWGKAWTQRNGGDATEMLQAMSDHFISSVIHTGGWRRTRPVEDLQVPTFPVDDDLDETL